MIDKNTYNYFKDLYWCKIEKIYKYLRYINTFKKINYGTSVELFKNLHHCCFDHKVIQKYKEYFNNSKKSQYYVTRHLHTPFFVKDRKRHV